MTAQGGYLLAWTNDAISQRERIARDAASEAGGSWREDPFVYGVRDQKNALVAKSREERAASIVHIAASDPASVLRRCATDRKLLELHRGDGWHCAVCAEPEAPSEDSEGEYVWSRTAMTVPCPTLLTLAEGYGWTGGER